MDKTTAFGTKFKALRVSKKLTQAALAEILGLNTHTIKDYEAGRRHPSIPTLAMISRTLGVSQSSLMDETETAPAELIEVVDPVASLARALEMLRVIPSEIIQLAQNFTADDKAWDAIRGTMKAEVIIKERRKASAKKQA